MAQLEAPLEAPLEAKRRIPRDLLVVTLAALAVRLVWNLVLHPPLDRAFTFADMGGYLERAQTSIDFPNDPKPYFTLFPWGTHFFVALVKRAFGPSNGPAFGVVFALMGTAAVAYGFAIARRFTRSVRISRAVGAVLVVYYPWISLGGYVLSEPLFTPFLCAAAFHGLAYADRGRPRDAWLFGGAVAVATVFRPQILAALPLYGLHFALRRGAWHRASLKTILPALAAPLALVAVVSAARMHFHTGAYGFVSRNSALNFAFGRCHATLISCTAPDRQSGYMPPALGALAQRDVEQPGSFFKLDPAMGANLHFTGHMWDAAPLRQMADDCVEKTGPARQARYAITHLALLWFFNTAWPDRNLPPYATYMALAQSVHNVLILPAALAAMALAFGKRHARAMLLALHVLALFGLAVFYFGETRLRVPYDGLLVTLAATTYAGALSAVRARLKARRPAVAEPPAPGPLTAP